MPVMWKDIKNRKLKVCAVVLFIGTVMAYIMNASYSEWTTFVIWIVGLYFGGNIGEHASRNLLLSKKTKEDSSTIDQKLPG